MREKQQSVSGGRCYLRGEIVLSGALRGFERFAVALHRGGKPLRAARPRSALQKGRGALTILPGSRDKMGIGNHRYLAGARTW